MESGFPSARLRIGIPKAPGFDARLRVLAAQE
jgi:hypothetical protein